MAFRKTAALGAVTTAATTVLGTVSLGAPFGVIKGFHGQNWASAAKAGAGTDAAEIVKLTDAAGRVVFLGAADADYNDATGRLVLLAGQDDTGTGLTGVAVDATGAAATAGATGEFVAQSPITVEIQNAATATDFFEISLFVEV